MIPVRTTVEISDGVKVELLFTPRVSVYEETVGPLPDISGETDFLRVMERYADIFYFAALNAWELDGHGTAEDFPHKRGDFHGWMSADPKGFAATVRFAVAALTGKSLSQIEKEAKPKEEGEPVEVKKKRRSWLSRLMRR